MVSVEVGRGEGAWGGEVSDLRLEAGLRGEDRFVVRSTGLGWGWGDKRSALSDCTSSPPNNNHPSPPSNYSTPPPNDPPPPPQSPSIRPPLQFFYQNWREFLFEPDVLLLMTALAAGPPQLFLADLMLAFGGKHLMCEAGVEICLNVWRSSLEEEPSGVCEHVWTCVDICGHV